MLQWTHMKEMKKVGKSHSNDSSFLITNYGDQKKWHNIFEVLKERNIDPENDRKLRDFINNISTL